MPFTALYPDFKEYFETTRALAGEPRDGKGRKLPPFEQRWVEAFQEGHERRKRWWEEKNDEARREHGKRLRAKL